MNAREKEIDRIQREFEKMAMGVDEAIEDGRLIAKDRSLNPTDLLIAILTQLVVLTQGLQDLREDLRQLKETA